MNSSRTPLIARYVADGAPRYGRVDAGHYRRMSAAPWEGGRETGERDDASRVALLTPSSPTKIVCVGLNYRAHVAESQTVLPNAEPPAEPLLFLKPPSAAVASGAAIVYPRGVTRLDPEGEIALIIGRPARAVSEADAPACIAGITCFNDVSARNYQKTDHQWARAKGFDTFAPFGPWVALDLPYEALAVECRVNGEVRQRGNSRDLLFAIPFLVSFISRIMTLLPGDVIATGTPAGIAPVVPGDRIEIEVEGVGVLVNSVVAAAASGSE